MIKKSRGSFEKTICKNDGLILMRWLDNSEVKVALTKRYGTQPPSTVEHYSKPLKNIIHN